MTQDFNLAAFELVIDRAIGARANHAFDLHTKLIADVFGHFEHLCTIGITDHLHITFAVTQIDEDHTTVVAPAIDPSTQRHRLSLQCFGDQSTVMRSHNFLSSLKLKRYKGHP